MVKRPNLSGWHVLIVDDDEPNAMVESNLLSVFKANIHIALSGASALAMLRELPQLTAVILDLKMPEMSGWQLLRHLKTMPEMRSVPLIAVTACVMPGDRERILGYGFDGYIPKPVRLATFWLELANFIAQKRNPTLGV